MELVDQELVIDEQKRLLDLALEQSAEEWVLFWCAYLRYSPDEKPEPGLTEEWKELERQKKLLEDDRKKFTDAAIKMGLERANLQVSSKSKDFILTDS